MKAKSIMFLGTGSNVGKSVLAAAFCRILKQDGFNVAPFKAQNMALNSYVTAGGGEMGRAQVVQAEACGLEPEVYMNPILMKPVADEKAQIIFMGRVVRNMSAIEYDSKKIYYLGKIKEILEELKRKFDFIIIEGAGSPAEVNLLKNDIVKSMLKQRLGLNISKQVYARKCEIFEITYETKRDFLNKFHIQGNDNSRIMLGAFSKVEGELVAVMTFSKPSIAKGSGKQIDGHWELNRFCTDSNYRVPGVAGKLLKHFQRNFSWIYIYSFADRRWSSGNLYNTLGFTLESDVDKIPPNYWYMDSTNLKRLHRFTLRKTKDDPKDIPEKMLRVSQGYNIIYDCGNLKYSILK